MLLNALCISLSKDYDNILVKEKFKLHSFNNLFFFLDSFVNSQEWTLSRTVPDIRLGIVGSLSSGKSALVHRYLTGSYMQV